MEATDHGERGDRDREERERGGGTDRGGGGGDWDDLRDKDDEERTIPRAALNKLIKERLADIRVANESRELILACCSEFIHLVTGKSNTICEEQQKKTMSADHLIGALDSVGFQSYKKDVESILKDCKGKRKRQSVRLEHLGIPLDELERQQQAIFRQAKEEQERRDHEEWLQLQATVQSSFNSAHYNPATGLALNSGGDSEGATQPAQGAHPVQGDPTQASHQQQQRTTSIFGSQIPSSSSASFNHNNNHQNHHLHPTSITSPLSTPQQRPSVIRAAPSSSSGAHQQPQQYPTGNGPPPEAGDVLGSSSPLTMSNSSTLNNPQHAKSSASASYMLHTSTSDEDDEEDDDYS